MAGLFDRPPPPRGLFEGILAGMGRGLTNPGGFFVNEGAPAAQALGSMVLSPFVQANQAMPWGGNDPSAIGIDPQQGSIDPSVMVPWATDVAGTVTAGAGMAPPVAGGAGMGIRAYHASPHDFDRFEFSPRTSGTGQGAQSYGPGIYHAESPAVSGPGGSYDKEFTAKNLGKYDLSPHEEFVLESIRSGQSDMEILRGLAGRGGITFDEAQATLDRVKKAKAHIYENEIQGNPDEFLDWDKPLSEQPENIRRALGWTPEAEAAFKKAQSGDTSNLLAALEGDAGYSPGKMPVPQGVPSLNAKGEDIALRHADKLRAAGIKGIRYKDAGSRGAMLRGQERIDQIAGEVAYLEGKIAKHSELYSDSPDVVQKWHDRLATAKSDLEKAKSGADLTNNYVVFDDDIISILKKYGLAGLTAGGAGAAMLGGGTDQAQAAQPPWMTGGRF